MTIETRTRIIPLQKIHVPPERQRSDAKEGIEDLAESIESRGLLHPIIVEEDGEKYVLVAGERRLNAYKHLARMQIDPFTKGIPGRLITDLTPVERFAVELEENIKRKDLPWQDEAKAYARYFHMLNEIWHEEESQDPNHDLEEDVSFAYVAGQLGVSERHCRRMTIVGRKVNAGDKEVLACDSAKAAGALLDRRMKRAAEIELTTFGEIELDSPVVNFSEDPDLNISLDELNPTTTTPQGEQVRSELEPYELIQVDFRTWAQDTPQGKYPPFNFIHCDFPYGKGLHKSDLFNVAAYDGKLPEDTDEVFWDLCETLKLSIEGGLVSKSAHIMFWFPMDKYQAVLEYLRSLPSARVDPYPLFWGKSDKMGIIPDPNRGPRRIYETAFICSLGDRKILRPTVNAAWADSTRRSGAGHVSTKPAIMLSEFFRMFIDGDSVVLDPTCGSGTAIETCIRRHCKFALGLDIDENSIKIANELSIAAHNLRIRGA